jgi:2-(1,2-epoxy-1,2-dihydrophenyl)acetyl-CoA isomerase
MLRSKRVRCRPTGGRVKRAASAQAVGPRGIARTKDAIYGSWARSLEQQLNVECAYQRELGGTSDYAEGVAAFSEKRAPRFTGQ